jgi:N-methylhydantoinase A
MEENAIEDMLKEGFTKEDVIIKRELDMKYGRQVHEVPIVIKNGELNDRDILKVSEEWERKYESIYGKGSGYKEAGVQIVSFMVTATCRTVKPQIRKCEDKPVSDASSALKSKRDVYFYNKFFDTDIYGYEKLRYGNIINGPAIIEAPTTTVVVFPDQRVIMDEYNNIVFKQL